MVKVCFCLLHYLAINSTEECVDSLLKLDGIQDCKIVIYDNGTPNDEYHQLEKRYDSISNVIVVRSESNDGFTIGNNKAYAYAKTFDPDFIVCMNNDVLVEQPDFIEKLYALDKAYYVIGPDVYNRPQKVHQSPICKDAPNKEVMKGFQEKTAYELAHLDEICALIEKDAKKAKLKKVLPYSLIRLARNFHLGGSSVAPDARESLFEKSQENAVLQGSFVIFTKKWIEKEDCAFEPDTMFYCEEYLLALKCKSKGYETLYTPELQIIHNHGVATGMALTNQKEKLRITNERMLHAYDVYLDALENNPWKE